MRRVRLYDEISSVQQICSEKSKLLHENHAELTKYCSECDLFEIPENHNGVFVTKSFKITIQRKCFRFLVPVESPKILVLYENPKFLLLFSLIPMHFHRKNGLRWKGCSRLCLLAPMRVDSVLIRHCSMKLCKFGDNYSLKMPQKSQIYQL